MLSRSKAKRAVMAAVVAAAVGASGAATADAAMVTRTDDTAADFTAGTQNGTIVARTDAAAGVEIAPHARRAVRRRSGAADRLDVDAVGRRGTSTVGGGALIVDGARADTRRDRAGPGSSVDVPRRRSAPRAVPPRRLRRRTSTRSRGRCSAPAAAAVGDGLYARTSDGDGPAGGCRRCPLTPVTRRRTRTGSTGRRPASTSTSTASQVATQAFASPTRCRSAGERLRRSAAGGVSVESATLRARTTGTFTSRALDAGDPTR